jgi:predicted negative regulator of RcsB-dependent stress response
VQAGSPHERIQKLLVTGDNRLKQGVDHAKARESYEQALALAREAGLEDSIRPLVEIRLADLEKLQSRGSTRPGAPAR